MRKPNSSAAERTFCLLPDIMKEQQNHAPEIVEMGIMCHRIDLAAHGDARFAWHYYAMKDETLCGILIEEASRPSADGNLGTCQECRSEASKRRMVVVT